MIDNYIQHKLVLVGDDILAAMQFARFPAMKQRRLRAMIRFLRTYQTRFGLPDGFHNEAWPEIVNQLRGIPKTRFKVGISPISTRIVDVELLAAALADATGSENYSVWKQATESCVYLDDPEAARPLLESWQAMFRVPGMIRLQPYSTRLIPLNHDDIN